MCPTPPPPTRLLCCRAAANLAGLGVTARVGDRDQAVPPYYVRRMRRLLVSVGAGPARPRSLENTFWLPDDTSEAACAADPAAPPPAAGLSSSAASGPASVPASGFAAPKGSSSEGAQPVNVTLDELPGKEHWWWDTSEANDGGVTNDPDMRAAYAAAVARSKAFEAAFNDNAEDGAQREGREGVGPEHEAQGGDRGSSGYSGTWGVTASEVGVLASLAQTSAGAGAGARVEMACPNPATFSGRFGVRPLQLDTAAAAGRVTFVGLPPLGPPSVSFTATLSDGGATGSDAPCWSLETANVRRMRLSRSSPLAAPHCLARLPQRSCSGHDTARARVMGAASLLLVDGSVVDLGPCGWGQQQHRGHARAGAGKQQRRWAHLCRDRAGRWELCGGCGKADDDDIDDDVDDDNEGAFERWERGPLTLGPARQVSARPFAVVVGSGRSGEQGGNGADSSVSGPASSSAMLLAAVGVYVASLHAMAADTYAPVVEDTRAVASGQGLGRNAIVVGGPHQNTFARTVIVHSAFRAINSGDSGSGSGGSGSSFRSTVLDEGGHVANATYVTARGAPSAVSWSADGSSFAVTGLPCGPFDEPGTAILYLAPFWEENPSSSSPGGKKAGGSARLALVAAGLGDGGLRLAARLAQPTIPPMTRAPFTNLLPDWVRCCSRSITPYSAAHLLLRICFDGFCQLTPDKSCSILLVQIVLGPEANLWGYGGVRAAGFWGNEWEFDPRSSYVNC